MNIEERYCHNCHHDKFWIERNKCCKCGTAPTKLVKKKNKHNKTITKVMLK